MTALVHASCGGPVVPRTIKGPAKTEVTFFECLGCHRHLSRLSPSLVEEIPYFGPNLEVVSVHPGSVAGSGA